jgi:TPP-dependent pyruvate/acetoin dehydrogenase alpha subunit
MNDKTTGERERLAGMYRSMVRIRLFEQKVNELFLQGLVPGTIHLYAGQEAVAVGVCSALQSDDIIVSTHRPHGHAIAKGLEPKHILAEILARGTGCCRGRGGSMHIGDITKGMLPALAIVAAGIPIAAGIALSFRLRGVPRVAVSFFGDGATNEGAFHEGLNLAAVWRLPAVFICENNLYGVSTRISSTALVENLSDRAAAYGMPGVTVDGNSVLDVHAAAAEAVERARNGDGPALVECKTYRHWGHSRTDPASYRAKQEVEAWLEKDPLKIGRENLEEQGWTAEAIARIDEEEAAVIESAAEFAVKSGPPPADTAVDEP